MNSQTSGFASDTGRKSGRGRRFWVNWGLAALTVLVAVLVRIFALGAVMSTAACSTSECPDLGPSGFWFTVFYYGPPVVAAATVLASFFTAGRPRGFIVPVVALGLLAADVVALTVSFNI